MRKYLLSGFIVFQRPGDWLPLQEVVTVADDTFMDEGGLRKFEAYFLEQNNRTYTIASRVAITAFQPLEHRPPVLPRTSLASRDVVDKVMALSLGRPRGAGYRTLQEGLTSPLSAEQMVRAYRDGHGADIARLWRPAEEDVQLNTCEKIMPPVDSPLLIEVAPGVLLRAIRKVHVEPRSAPMMFELDAGGLYTGRPRWTHP